MKHLLPLLLLLLASCAGTRRPPATPVASEPIAAPGRLDSAVVVPHRTLLDKVLGRTPQADNHVGQLPAKIGKKSTVSIYYGPATVSTVGKKATVQAEGAVNVGKNKGPLATGEATVTDNTKAGQRGGAAATAAGATATATTVKPPTPWLKYGLWLAGLGGAYWVLFGGGGLTLLALWRKNKPSEDSV